MSLEVLISIVGAFGVLALSINAFFLKGIYSELNDVKVKIATIISGSDFLKTEIADLQQRLNEQENVIQEMQLELVRLNK